MADVLAGRFDGMLRHVFVLKNPEARLVSRLAAPPAMFMRPTVAIGHGARIGLDPVVAAKAAGAGVSPISRR